MSDRVKIIIASGIYPPDIGGPATYSRLVVREFIKRGIGVTVICYSDEKKEFIDQEEKFEILRISRRYNILFRYWLYFWSLFNLAKNKDVIYAQGPLAAGFPAMLVSKILRKKFVIKIVGDYAWEQYQNKNKGIDLIESFQNKKYDFLTELRRRIQKLVVKKADKVIVPSEFLKKIVAGWDVDERKIEVIYNAFSEPEKIKSVKLDGDVIISAGRPEPWKGFNTLNEIMPDLLKENPRFKLIIATKMSHDELMGYFKASKIFVLNSGYEGFSHIILEAMACGLPVIVTKVCGNPEIIQDGYNGLLVEYNNKEQLKDTILRLWEDKKLREKFIENGKKTLGKFTLDKMINKTIKLLFEFTN